MEVWRQRQLVSWALGAGLALPACGETTVSQRELGSSGAGSVSETGSVSEAGSGGVAGSAAPGGTGGSVAGAAGGGGGQGGVAETVPPAVSAAWVWSECGRIPESVSSHLPHVGRGVASLAISGDGQLLVSNDGLAIAWRVAEPFEASQPLWWAAGEGAFNTDVSPDGRWVATSGDTRAVFDARSGARLALPGGDEPIAPNPLCIGTELRFSPDSRYVAGKRYGTTIDVFDLATLARVTEIETKGCGQGLVFGAERITSPEGSFRTSDWTATSALTPTPSTEGFTSCAVHLEPASAIPTTCCSFPCETQVGGTILRGGRHPRLSREGHWLVTAGTLVHLPSGETRDLDSAASEALFAPNGDVIVGEGGGDLVRFCRSD